LYLRESNNFHLSSTHFILCESTISWRGIFSLVPASQLDLCQSIKNVVLYIELARKEFLRTRIKYNAGMSIVQGFIFLNRPGLPIYGPSHGRPLALSLLDEEGNDLGRNTDPIHPLYFCKLAKLGRRVAEQHSVMAKIVVRNPQTIGRHENCTDAAAKTRIASLADTLHIPQLLEDPSPQLFLAACFAFAFAVAALQHLHKKDLYLNRILVSGLIAGCAAAFQSTNALMELKSYLAWSAILALMLNDLVHLALRLWQGPTITNNGLETRVQLHDKSCERKEGQDDQFYSQGLRHPDILEVRGN
jgi:hypothetical protein